MNLVGNIEDKRHTGLDLLRILSMIFVCVLHFLGHGGILDNVETYSLEYFVAWIFETLAFPAVNCFVLISGYFLSKAQFKPSRIFKLVIQALFYSLICLLVVAIVNPDLIGIKTVIKSLTPISSSIWWFVSCYFQLLILAPLLNFSIKHMNRNQYKVALIGLFIITSIMANLLVWSSSKYFLNGYSIVWFIVLYYTAAYISKYEITVSKGKTFLVYIGMSAALFATRLVITLVSQKLSFGQGYIGAFYDYNSVFVFGASVALFLFFKDLRFKSNGVKTVITKVAPLTFGVYLVHDNEYIRGTMYEILNMSRFADSTLEIMAFGFLFVASVFCIGIAVEFIFVNLYKISGLKKAEKKINQACFDYIQKGSGGKEKED